MLTFQRFALGALQTNAYVVVNEDRTRALIIDPGTADGALMRKLDGLKVEAILLTHAHFDHIGGVDQLRKKIRLSGLLASRGAGLADRRGQERLGALGRRHSADRNGAGRARAGRRTEARTDRNDLRGEAYAGPFAGQRRLPRRRSAVRGRRAVPPLRWTDRSARRQSRAAIPFDQGEAVYAAGRYACPAGTWPGDDNRGRASREPLCKVNIETSRNCYKRALQEG